MAASEFQPDTEHAALQKVVQRVMRSELPSGFPRRDEQILEGFKTWLVRDGVCVSDCHYGAAACEALIWRMFADKCPHSLNLENAAALKVFHLCDQPARDLSRTAGSRNN